MNVTFQILLYLYSNKYSVIRESSGIGENEVTAVRRFDSNADIDRHTLYILTPDDLKQMEAGSKPEFPFFLLTPSGKLPLKKDLTKIERCSYAVTDEFYTTFELQTALLQILQDLLHQENSLLLATMDSKRSEEVFAFGKNWFPWEYSIVDLDMHLLYRTDKLHKVLGSGKVDRIPNESLRELILSKEFHDAARKKDIFYQSMTFNELTAVAKNILPDGQYAGRIVMFLPKPLKQIPRGAEELFAFFADCVMEALRRSSHFTGRKQNDPLHLLCRSLFQGETAAEHATNDVLRRINWKNDHLFSVVTFRFLADSAWEAQLETTLPYLADELELEWPNSCAVISKREINWILNLSLSGLDSDLNNFHQQVSYFVRDHVCIAGASSAFQNFLLLNDAKKSANAALELGSQKNPHLWFHSFDDYRLDYMKETLQNSLAANFLYHPAIYKLEHYDQENKTELTETLKAFLENGRNMTAAADAIFVHRTTFCRRMDHIKKLTGLNLDDLSTVIQLELSFQL